LKISEHQLDSIATFYSLIFRKPVGRHVILICDSMACYVTGYETIREQIEKKLGVTFGQTTEDGEFTFLNIPCLGACEQAPAMIVDETLYGDLTPRKIDEILDSIRGTGQ
jgi:NADH-quinone oxidoreductase subunit E